MGTGLKAGARSLQPGVAILFDRSMLEELCSTGLPMSIGGRKRQVNES